MFPPAVRTPLGKALAGVGGQLPEILADIGVDLFNFSSPTASHGQRAEDVLRWLEARGRTHTRALLAALLAEFGGDVDMQAAVGKCSAHLDVVAPSVTAVRVARRILGKAFADREDVRHYVLTEFASVEHPNRIVVVNGEAKSGKSYLWNFLNHAAGSLFVDAVLIDLEKEVGLTAAELCALIVDQAVLSLPLDHSIDPTATPERQARSLVARLVGWHKKGEASGAPPLWIVLDHLDKVWPMSAGVGQFIEHLGQAIVQRKAEGLRLILLGAPPEVAKGWLEDELDRRVLDQLTPGDLTEWLRDELDGLGFEIARLDSEAQAVHGEGTRLLHQRLALRCAALRAERGGAL